MKPSFIALLLGLLTLSLVYNYFDERVIEVPVVVPVAEGGAPNIQLGTRPYFLIDDMDEGVLKTALEQCADGPFYRTDFSIGHRGAPLQYPEHTRESYIAAARMGAGMLECDVTFTADKELVCRHSQCDLHTTTNILATELASKCSVPFMPADLEKGTRAQAKCCTNDITLAEFKTLQGKMDGANWQAKNVEDFMGGTPNWRTDLNASNGTLMTHAESIALFQKLGTKMIPELKSPQVSMPYKGFTQQDYTKKLIDEYVEAGVVPGDVWPQSFNLADVEYWIEHHPDFGEQAVYLEGRYSDPNFKYDQPETWNPSMEQLADSGIKVVAPPLWMLVTLDKANNIVPSIYTKMAKAAGLELIAWTLERSGPLKDGGGWYYRTITEVINNEGDQVELLHVLAEDVGVIGVFSDWPATTSYYASCMRMPASL
ncbi:glycerophosphoryl diester phosphodiesterase [Vibrio ishigakensis]|uniref:glycerophosphodiester phosphodiesterase n=1 Tax=Vibrio ishigakensis TaxID=1481914 RepID=A0A0B8P194_9VIBR|nr:glycerophosphodiester phosphodiesterase family protein [Vibrio ishigakensis]GAM58347.1 glycerophosphoryl diester phosphodiesterase [Vibrio ishigakensis]